MISNRKDCLCKISPHFLLLGKKQNDFKNCELPVDKLELNMETPCERGVENKTSSCINW